MMNEEMITKAKEAKSVGELIALAKENGVELNEEDAKMYFEQLNAKKGELSDDELDNVAGGGCYTNDGRLVVTVLHFCKHWTCKCGSTNYTFFKYDPETVDVCNSCGNTGDCRNCRWCVYEDALWKCNNPANMK